MHVINTYPIWMLIANLLFYSFVYSNMNTESQISKQAPSNAMEDRHRPSDLVSPRPNHPSSHAHTQFPMGYQMNSPYCQPDPQRIRENAMYMRDCQYSHMGMPSHGAFSNCWAHPCSCHHRPRSRCNSRYRTRYRPSTSRTWAAPASWPNHRRNRKLTTKLQDKKRWPLQEGPSWYVLLSRLFTYHSV